MSPMCHRLWNWATARQLRASRPSGAAGRPRTTQYVCGFAVACSAAAPVASTNASSTSGHEMLRQLNSSDRSVLKRARTG